MSAPGNSGSLLDAHDKLLQAIDLDRCAWLAAGVNADGLDLDVSRDAMQATLNAARQKQFEVLAKLEAARKAG